MPFASFIPANLPSSLRHFDTRSLLELVCQLTQPIKGLGGQYIQRRIEGSDGELGG
jgi:hypothetical protein